MLLDCSSLLVVWLRNGGVLVVAVVYHMYLKTLTKARLSLM